MSGPVSRRLRSSSPESDRRNESLAEGANENIALHTSQPSSEVQSQHSWFSAFFFIAPSPSSSIKKTRRQAKATRWYERVFKLKYHVNAVRRIAWILAVMVILLAALSWKLWKDLDVVNKVNAELRKQSCTHL